MSLSASLQVGRTGLLVNQAAIQVTGNNMANLATEGYHRQRINFTPVESQQISQGVFVGRGVAVADVTRLIDEALETRLRNSISDQSNSTETSDLLSRIEAIEAEYSGIDLSTQLGAFFDAFSQLADNPQDASLRTLATQQADSLCQFVNNMRDQFAQLRVQTYDALGHAVSQVNSLLSKVEQLNRSIAQQSAGGGGAPGLRDQRDLALSQLAEYMDISTVESETGVVDVFVGSLPVMLNGQSRGLEVSKFNDNGELGINVIIGDDKSKLPVTSGRLAAMIDFKDAGLSQATETLDQFAAQLIWQTNRLHSQGQGTSDFTSLTSATQVLDPDATLTDLEKTGLGFAASHGSFEIAVRQKSTGQLSTYVVHVDLDGIDPTNDTTLNSLISDIDAVDNIRASLTADGRIRIEQDSSDFEFSFSHDTSGALASLGINTLFTGSHAGDIAVNQTVMDNPAFVAAGLDHLPGDNQNALAINNLRDAAVAELGGMSLTQYWNRHVEDLAIRIGQAQTKADADAIVRTNLTAQQQEQSGVSSDEEAIDLLGYQRAYQASARFLTVVDEMLQILMSVL